MDTLDNAGKGLALVSGRSSHLQTAEQRTRQHEKTFFDLVEEYGVVEEVFHAVRDAMTEASMSVRVPDKSAGARGWTYAIVPDRPVRVAAARTMAQMLGLIKTSTGPVTNNTSQTLNLTQGDSLAQLAAVGVPRETVEAACRDLLASVSVSDGDAGKTTKSG